MATGVAWVVGARLLVRLLGVIGLAVLARLLQPSDYGLIALATAFAAAIELFGAFDFEVWLVRQPAPTPAHCNTVWTLSVLRSVFTAAALCLGADGVALVFSEPRLVDVVHVLALGILVSALTHVGVVDFQRDLRFDRAFAYLGLVKFGSFGVALGVALWQRSCRALLTGMVAGQALRVVFSCTLSRYRPRLCLKYWREVFVFSKRLLAGNVFGFAYRQSGTFLLGRLAMPEAVGLYAVAREIADLAPRRSSRRSGVCCGRITRACGKADLFCGMALSRYLP